MITPSTTIKKIIGLLLLTPLFFQISNGLFQSKEMAFMSNGRLLDLPIPISVIACYAGIVLFGHYRRAHLSLSVIFFTFILMVMTTVIASTGNPSFQQSKLILLIQFILPMFALVLGQIFENTNKILEKTFLFVLLILVPWQLVATWSRGYPCLHPSVGFFSIYQHLQYVPVILITAYSISLTSLWELQKYRYALLVLMPFMAVYSAASMSMLAIGGLLIFVGLFILYQRNNFKSHLVVALLLSATLAFGYLQNAGEIFSRVDCGFTTKSKSFKVEKQVQLPSGNSESAGTTKAPPNFIERAKYWKHYYEQIISSPLKLLIGHESAPKRSEYPSAHNYYLDFIYNFGLFALVPISFLLIRTCQLTYQRRGDIWKSSGFFGLCMVSLFLLFIDNSLKVSLRQPYPGIFTYFVWGLLLSRLTTKPQGRPIED